MDAHPGSPGSAMELLCALVGRDEELVGEEPLLRLLECARETVSASAARLDRSGQRRSSSPVERCGGGVVKITGPQDGSSSYPVLVLEGCSPGEFSATQSWILLLCGSMIGSVVRATQRRAQRERREARRDAVHAVAMAAVQHEEPQQ